MKNIEYNTTADLKNIVAMLSELNTTFRLLNSAFSLLSSSKHLDKITAETFAFFGQTIDLASKQFDETVTELNKITKQNSSLSNVQKEKGKIS